MAGLVKLHRCCRSLSERQVWAETGIETVTAPRGGNETFSALMTNGSKAQLYEIRELGTLKENAGSHSALSSAEAAI